MQLARHLFILRRRRGEHWQCASLQAKTPTWLLDLNHRPHRRNSLLSVGQIYSFEAAFRQRLHTMTSYQLQGVQLATAGPFLGMTSAALQADENHSASPPSCTHFELR